MSLAGKITVDLIADHEHTVTQANLADPAQFFLAPDTSDRVVRTAKQEQFDLIFHDLRFQSIQIHRVIAIRDFQRAVDNLTPIVRNYFRKRMSTPAAEAVRRHLPFVYARTAAANANTTPGVFTSHSGFVSQPKRSRYQFWTAAK